MTTMTITIDFPPELVEELALFRGMPTQKEVPNPDIDDVDLEEDNALTHMTETILEDWSRKEMLDFVSKEVKDELLAMAKPVVSLPELTGNDLFLSNEKKLTRQLRIRDVCLNSAVKIAISNDG